MIIFTKERSSKEERDRQQKAFTMPRRLSQMAYEPTDQCSWPCSVRTEDGVSCV